MAAYSEFILEYYCTIKIKVTNSFLPKNEIPLIHGHLNICSSFQAASGLLLCKAFCYAANKLHCFLRGAGKMGF